jgi:parallel beta-helix repeat protein
MPERKYFPIALSFNCFLNPLIFVFKNALLGIFIIFFYGIAFASDSTPIPPGKKISTEVLQQIQALQEEKSLRSPAQKKIDSQIIYSLKVRRKDLLLEKVPHLRSTLEIAPDDTVLVDIKARVTPGLLHRIEMLGGEIINNFPHYDSIRARMHLEKIEFLADHSNISFIEPAVSAMTQKQGSYSQVPGGASPHKKVNTSEGDIAHNATLARDTYGVDGTGIKIGVLSDSVDHLATVKRSTDLPDVTVLEDAPGNTGEGTAMLEIIHDLAPGAELYFATALNGVASFADNIVQLQEAGCNIIVDNILYFNESPFQDGTIAQAVKSVTEDGVLYFAAAGNSGNLNDATSGGWEGDFHGITDPFLPGNLKALIVHDFGGGVTANIISGGSPLYYTLFWSDPPGNSGNDYDLYLLKPSGSIEASSTNIQDGDDDPYESIIGEGASDVGYKLVITKSSGAVDRFIHLSSNGGELEQGTTGNIRGHAAVQDAFAVAAVDALERDVAFDGSESVETFSSDGLRRVFYYADGTPITPGDLSSTGGAVRSKPDLTAADGVATATPGFLPFYGTSAAVPHAAAIAGLLLDVDPSLSPTGVRAVLTGSTLDIETPGWDRDSGYGIVMADLALASLSSGFSLLTTPFSQEICIPDDAVYSVDVLSVYGFLEPVTLSVSGEPAGTTASFSLNPVQPGNSSELIISNTGSALPGDYTLQVFGIAQGADDRSGAVELTLNSSVPDPLSLNSPADGATGLSILPEFSWNQSAQATTYDIEIATDSNFNSIVYSASGLKDTTHAPSSAFNTNTTYYWRVNANNGCGTTLSSPFSFITDSIIYVGSGETFLKIQSAIDAAKDGDTIIVRDGIYAENVQVGKELTIQSENGYEYTTVISGNKNGHVFYVNSDYVTIEGFTIYGAKPLNSGIFLDQSNYSSILNNRFGYDFSHKNYNGLEIFYSNHNRISGNICSFNVQSGILLNFTSSFNHVHSNTCNSNGSEGIYLYWKSNNNVISNNTCNFNRTGIFVWEKNEKNTITNNTCTSNSDSGIHLEDDSIKNVITKNILELNTVGILIGNLSDNNNIFLNNFMDNSSNVSSPSGSVSYWDSPTSIFYDYRNGSLHKSYIGNYYSDQSLTDSDNDGVADNSYDLPDSEPDDLYPLAAASDNYSLLAWWLNNDNRMYRDDMGKRYGEIIINKAEQNVWTSNQYTLESIDFSGNDTWTGQIAFTAPPSNGHTFTIEIGSSADGTNFTPGGPDALITGDGSERYFVFETDSEAFSVPPGEYIALRVTNNNNGKDYTVMTGGAFSYVSSDVTCSDVLHYRDIDGDGYGNTDESTLACTSPAGYVTRSNDCDDNNDAIHPDASEECDNLDNDCNGAIDDDLTRQTFCGLGECADNTGTETCTVGQWGGNTCDPLAGATAEQCDNLDNDCNGAIDDDLTRQTFCGLGECADNTGTETCTIGQWGGNTCDPLAGATAEQCDNLDNDCDGQTDEGLLLNTYYRDFDEDTYGDPLTTTDECAQPVGYVSDNTDCDDNAWEINPGALEGPPDDLTCSDENDNDCDGYIDAEDPGCIECLGPICLPVESGQILNLVTWYYQSILDRDPEPSGAEGWAAEIQRILSLGIDVKEGFIALGKLFFNSEEYIDMGNTDESYIIDLYETFLGRTPSGIGEEVGEVDDWMAELEGGLTRNLLLNYFIFSEEFRVYMECEFGLCVVRPEYSLVNDLYRGFLSRLPDDEGFNAWLALMQVAQCTGDQAVRDLTNEIGLLFIQGAEYAARNPEFLDPPDNQLKNPDFSSEFVTNLYDAVLRRGAELAGYLAWKEQYDSDTLTKEEILQFFVESAEFQGRVQEVIDAGCSL